MPNAKPNTETLCEFFKINSMTNQQVDKEIARLIGWKNIRKKINTQSYSGINPCNNLRESIPKFSQSMEDINLAETYVTQQVGIEYLVYLGKISEMPGTVTSWLNIKQAFLSPAKRAKACLAALMDCNNKKKVL